MKTRPKRDPKLERLLSRFRIVFMPTQIAHCLNGTSNVSHLLPQEVKDKLHTLDEEDMRKIFPSNEIPEEDEYQREEKGYSSEWYFKDLESMRYFGIGFRFNQARVRTHHEWETPEFIAMLPEFVEFIFQSISNNTYRV